MDGVRLRIHPLFFLFGIYYGFVGKFFLFLMTTLCAVIHELGHSLVASKHGYRLNRITLMPFGAVVDGQIDGIKPFDEIKIALAGPLVNFAVGIFFVSVWWIYPEAYAYTDVVVSTCFALTLVNLIPAFPLDGGRVLNALLRIKLKKEVANKICLVIGAVLATFLFGTFVLSCFYKANLSLLFFALFIASSLVSKKSVGKYVKLYQGISQEKLKRGVAYKKQGVDASIQIKTLISILDEECINEIAVYQNGKQIALLNQEALSRILKESSIYDTIGQKI